MNIAVITKPNMQSHSTRLGVLELLKQDGSFNVEEYAFNSELSDTADAILVFGGDGTVLEAVRLAGGADIPILGVNLGNMGFLTSFEQEADCAEIVECLKNGKKTSRMLLDVNVNGEASKTALNEVVIKTAGTRPITLDVIVDGAYVDTFHSDGIIVSSPAGSTAYSLSAGGPLIAPDVDAMLIIPICAHSLHSRPLVVNSSAKVEIELLSNYDAMVSVDGASSGILKKGKISVTRSSNKVTFLTAGKVAFYAKLLKKMNRWGTTLK